MFDLEFENLGIAIEEVTRAIPSRLFLRMARDGVSQRSVRTDVLSGATQRYYVDLSFREIAVRQAHPFFYSEQVRLRTVLLGKKTFGGVLTLYSNDLNYSLGPLRDNDLTRRAEGALPHGGIRMAKASETYADHHPF